MIKVKLYFENKESTMGGWEIVSLPKLIWWLFLGRINQKRILRYIILEKLKRLTEKEFKCRS